MEVARDIAGLSFPFVIGLASAALLPCGGNLYLKAGTGLAASAFLMLLYCDRGERRAIGWLMYAAIGWFCWQNAALCSLTADSSGGFLHDTAEMMLERFTALIASCHFSDRTEALLDALLTGQRGALDKETVQAFRRSGASHILALSGLHLGIIYGIMVKVLGLLGNGRHASDIRSILIAALCTSYCLMTGCGPSIVRALIFIVINEISRHYVCRRRRPVNVLCTALTLQLASNPAVIGSLGFQLSYLAMTGIVTIFPSLEKWYPSYSGKMDIMRKIWSSVALTLSCQIFTAPLVWIRFHTFPLYFMLTNLIALPLTELLMTSSVSCLALKALSLTSVGCQITMIERACRLAGKVVEWGAESLMFHLETIASLQ